MSETTPAPGAAETDTGGAIPPAWFVAGNAMSDRKPTGTATATTAPTTPAQTGTDLPSHLIGRTSIGLLAVIGIILICAWALKRLGFQRDQRRQSLPIVASRSLGQRERVVVVALEDEWLVLGVTPQNITALHRRPAPTETAVTTPSPQATTTERSAFGQALADSLARFTGRRS
ncbi:flagellar biosynthetic protein FliO [Salinisphaera sp. Q1T1-3]|uniref:flagellar biosynthetic protein FliO n=1 Tax=Salinisphaera sp. Q1T1-3 TaxID=2321229 RepID=UPI000E753054|nr:flagellar biosynthetic protein FliO [Salinisphaera sp. Q1T1-3]RJS95159.1 flagellar biosynthetic protein FliO [Salinisphaera sp. Q1T1-3]